MGVYFRNDNNSYSLRGNEKPNAIIFAEGQTEALFLEYWLKKTTYNCSETAVICFRGQEKLPTLFRALSDEDNFTYIDRFGFLLDAESKPANAKISSIKNMLEKHQLVPTHYQMGAGQLVNINGKKIIAHICPNNNNKGTIEDVILNEIATTNLQPPLDDFSQKILNITGEKPNSKSLVQMYLSCKKPGLCGAGRAFEAGILDVMAPAYSGIRNSFIQLLA